MAEQNNEIPLEPAPDDPVYQLFTEIQSEIARLKKRPLDYGNFQVYFTGTVLPLMRDLAYRLFETSSTVDDICDRMDEEESPSTQFTVEDAKKFDFVLQFAKGMANAALESSGETEKAQLQQIIASAEECLQLVEQNTLDEEGDDEEEEEETPPAEQN
jgi:hypothetical protein